MIFKMLGGELGIRVCNGVSTLHLLSTVFNALLALVARSDQHEQAHYSKRIPEIFVVGAAHRHCSLHEAVPQANGGRHQPELRPWHDPVHGGHIGLGPMPQPTVTANDLRAHN